ncbi:hypothetical protein HYV69_01500 [Candidatus Uhrbacteria bacterium]|nr:hypothetical protein [Candidatus Uhrbacteria bacterium]
MQKCIDDYCDANAFEKRRTACWRCPQGRRNRIEFAISADGLDEMSEEASPSVKRKPTPPPPPERAHEQTQESEPAQEPASEQESGSEPDEETPPVDDPPNENTQPDEQPSKLGKGEPNMREKSNAVQIELASAIKKCADEAGWAEEERVIARIINSNSEKVTTRIDAIYRLNNASRRGWFERTSDGGETRYKLLQKAIDLLRSEASAPPAPTERKDKKRDSQNATVHRSGYWTRLGTAWKNTPGDTTEEKLKYEFDLNDAGELAKIIGVSTPFYARQLFKSMVDEGLIAGNKWTRDMSEYGPNEKRIRPKEDETHNTQDGEAGDQAKPAPDGDEENEETEFETGSEAETDVEVDDDGADATSVSGQEIGQSDIRLVTDEYPWVASTLKVAASIVQIPSEYRALFINAIAEFANVPPENLRQTIIMLSTIFPVSDE